MHPTTRTLHKPHILVALALLTAALVPSATARPSSCAPAAVRPSCRAATAQDAAAAQNPSTTGTVAGTVTLAGTGQPLHGARVLLIELGLSTLTDEQGRYRFDSVPPGEYRLVAVREHLQASPASVQVRAGTTATLDFTLALSAVHEEVTVTATGRETTPFDAFNTVDVLDSVDLAQKMAGSLGELLEGEPNVAKRSFGPGSSRPVIRGFDNDRVLVMQDGVRTGDLSSQSGDHGVSIDPGSLEKVEVLKGPATLLYGSSAIGGVVNAITPQQQFYAHPPRELRGQVTLDSGSANGQAGSNGNFQYGSGAFMLWFGGGARRAGDYHTPIGPVDNSGSRSANGRLGGGWFGERGWVSAGYQIEDGRYGVPFAGLFEADAEAGSPGDLGTPPRIDLDTRRQSVRLDTGLREIDGGPVRSLQAAVTWIDWHHDEIEEQADGSSEIGTSFDNTTWIGRLEAEQRTRGRLSGRFGVWAQHRDYTPRGAEALSPPVVQRSFAAFTYQELALPGWQLQFGARLERNAYEPEPRARPEAPPTRDRSFTGVSASLGARVPLAGDRVALVASLTSSYRAPALEELYNFGPHVGNLAFEFGNPELRRERSTGGEFSLRWQGRRAHGNVNFFLYDIDDFVFPAPTGRVREGLIEVELLQGNARYLGADASAQLHLTPELELQVSGGWVRAELRDSGEPVPRIPPASGRLALDWMPVQQLHLRPSLVLTAAQRRVFRAETPTAGYTLANLLVSYMIVRAKAMHVLSLNLTNLTDELYRNHNSFIKELAPEIGRRVLLTYSLRLF